MTPYILSKGIGRLAPHEGERAQGCVVIKVILAPLRARDRSERSTGTSPPEDFCSEKNQGQEDAESCTAQR